MLNYQGLRKRASYDGLVDYLEHHQEIIKYPNRTASRIIDNGLGNIFEEYEQKKKMAGMAIFNMINGDKSTQTDFERNNGVQVHLNRFREDYETKLATGYWHLENGSVKHFTSWRERQNRTMQIQTMSLEANKRYYKANGLLRN